ncbi:MAG: tetratricopeptide repeat protein, partial [Bacteroidota bacterium]
MKAGLQYGFIGLLMLLLLGPTQLKADEADILAWRDSVIQAKDPIQKASILRVLARKYRNVSPRKADSVAREGLLLAKKHHARLLEARLLFQLGNIYRQQGLYVNALSFYERALPIHQAIADTLPANRIRVAYTHNQIGLVHKARGEFAKAIEAYNKALAIKEDFRREQGDRYLPTTINTYTNIGAIYNLLEKWDRALRYHELCEAMLKATARNKFAKARATVYANLSHTHLKIGNPDKAEIYLKRQNKLIGELEDKVLQAEYYANYGHIQFQKGDFNAAVIQYQRAIKGYQQLGYTYQITDLHYELAQVYMAAGDTRRAKNILEEALNMAAGINANQLIAEGYLHLSNWYEANGDVSTALSYYKQHLAEKGKIFDEKTVMALKEMEVMVNVSESEDQLKLMGMQQSLQAEQLRSQRQLIITSLIVLGLALLALFAFVRSNRTEKRLNQSLGEKNRVLSKTLDQLNITVEKLQESEASLSAANHTKDKLFSIISHDLRGQFGSIMSFTQIFKDQVNLFSPDELETFAHEFHASSQSIFNLFENLLNWSKAQMEEVE